MKRIFLLVLFIIAQIAGRATGARYLVVTHDNFYAAVLPYAQWKHKMGFKTKIAKLSEIGPTSNQIRNYIVNAYTNWQIKPEYVLLVGAPYYLPMQYMGGVYTDNYYTNMDADIYNEILSGRLNVHSTTEAQTVVAKMLRYERTPDLSDPNWFKKACLMVNEEGDAYWDSIYWSDLRDIAAKMVANGFVAIDSLSDFSGDTVTQLVDATNQGRAFVVYRGNATNYWYPPFNINPDVLANGNKLPIVVSATCGTLGWGYTPTVSERWFFTGLPNYLRGAAGYFATTTSGYMLAHLRSAVVRGFFDGLFVSYLERFGAACENGRRRVYDTYGSYSEYYGFTTVGDPAMNVWIRTPRYPVVTHPAEIPYGANDINVHVTVDGLPVQNALVCVMQKDTVVYETGLTDAAGDADLSFTVSTDDSLYITVTGHYIYPYESSIKLGIEEDLPAALKAGGVLAVGPNPVRARMEIDVDRSRLRNRDGPVAVKIYDAAGRVRKNWDFSHRDRDLHLVWLADDQYGRALAAGVYFVVLSTPEESYRCTVTLIR